MSEIPEECISQKLSNLGYGPPRRDRPSHRLHNLPCHTLRNRIHHLIPHLSGYMDSHSLQIRHIHQWMTCHNSALRIATDRRTGSHTLSSDCQL